MDRSGVRQAVWGLWAPMLLLAAAMWRVRAFTIDDAYISFRYARNLAAGDGLVYNVGERVEGYTNFLWTLMLAGGIELGIDPHVLSKSVGAVCACGTLVIVYRLAQRVQPSGAMPCVATWLAASSIVLSGHAVWGLETAAFTFLVSLGAWWWWCEVETKARFPWSAAILSLAGLVRPEAPLVFLLMAAVTGRRLDPRQHGLRLLVFAIPLLVHLAWRHAYYGSWLPNTAIAKTGDWEAQVVGGLVYVHQWVTAAGPLMWLGAWTIARKFVARDRVTISLLVVSTGFGAYVIAIGGDWVPFHRFMAPIEPLLCVFAGAAIRDIWERGDGTIRLALGLSLLVAGVERAARLHVAQQRIVEVHEPSWRETRGAVVDWLLAHPPGRVCVGDLGYIGWATNYPVLDPLGLMDPKIARLPGGYTNKIGPGYVERFFEVMPDYFVYSPVAEDCARPHFEADRKVMADVRFSAYTLAGQPTSAEFGSFCIAVPRAVLRAPEDG